MMFRSFYLAGFECATGWNMHREWIDQIAATGHDVHVDADYARLAEAGIHAVREGIRWPLVDRGGRLDFSSVEPFVQAAHQHGFDVIWDLFHYGYPEDLDPFGAAFLSRFERYCRGAARFIRERCEGPHFFTPVNEPSYFAWAGAEAGHFAPHVRGRGFDMKLALAHAAIVGIDAIRQELPRARIVNVDPICHVVPRPGVAADVEHARLFNTEWVYEFWDIVRGRKHPRLGGSAAHLDIVGINYYWTNQWELGDEGTPLSEDDPRRVSLADLVRNTWRRYDTEIVITETSALGEARAPWISELSTLASRLIAEGVPLRGVCLYPILGMPEWHARGEWTRMGLWDVEHADEALLRTPCPPGLNALRCALQSTTPHRLASERAHSLQRTGDSNFRFVGELLWQHTDEDAGPVLRVFRSDWPHRLWIAAMELHGCGTPLHHVNTAARLPLLIDQLMASAPAQIAHLHNRGVPREDPAFAHDRWRALVAGLAQAAPQLELVCIRPHHTQMQAPSAMRGGGRR